jgi:putative FmdB family regulatory protein
MPTYRYRCSTCGDELEVWQSFSEEPLTVHDDCGGELRKVLSPAGIVLKGSGFYKTDNRSGANGGSRSPEKRESEKKDSDTGSSGSGSSGSGDSSSSSTKDSGSGSSGSSSGSGDSGSKRSDSGSAASSTSSGSDSKQ